MRQINNVVATSGARRHFDENNNYLIGLDLLGWRIVHACGALVRVEQRECPQTIADCRLARSRLGSRQTSKAQANMAWRAAQEIDLSRTCAILSPPISQGRTWTTPAAR
jgi:hypothetical protein